MKRGRGGVAVTAEWSVSYLRHSSSQGLVLQQTYYKGMLTGSTLAAASGCLAAVKSRWEGIVLSHQSKHWTDSAKLWLRFSASEGDCIRRSLRTSSWYDGSNRPPRSCCREISFWHVKTNYTLREPQIQKSVFGFLMTADSPASTQTEIFTV